MELLNSRYKKQYGSTYTKDTKDDDNLYCH